MLLGTAAALVLFLTAQPAPAADHVDLTFAVGPRIDNFNWNIAASSGSPNILSGLDWKNLEILQVKATERAVVARRLYLRASLGFGYIYDGSNQDSDYAGDNRTGEYSRSNNDAAGGTVWDASVGGGYIVPVGQRISFIPLAGFSYHKQNLTLSDGYQTIATAGLTPPVGPFSGLDSTYEARWYGPWAGFDLSYTEGKVKLIGAFEYHLARYRAVADWNLRSDFQHPKSFEHWADGTGVVVSVNGFYALGKNLSLTGSVDVQSWQTGTGTDRTYSSGGGASDTRLNEVDWESVAVLAGLAYTY